MDELAKEISLPMNGDQVTVAFSVKNLSKSNTAKSVRLWIRICNDCKYVSEPAESVHVNGALDTERTWNAIDLPPDARWQREEVVMPVPRPYNGMMFGIRYAAESSSL